MELLSHLKINNFNCELQIYAAADTRIEISLEILKTRLFQQFSNFKDSYG